MTTNSTKPDKSVIQWLLDSDPSIRWQALRDLQHAPAAEVAAERAKVATEGWGAALLAAQTEGGIGLEAMPRLPEYTSLRTLLLLRDMGLDPASEQAKTAVARVRKNVQWLMNIPKEDLPKDEDISWWHKPFFEGEVEPCINGRVVTIGAYFGEDMQPIVERLLGEQMADGGWNCDQEQGSTRGSFHTTIDVLEGLLEFERATGGSPAVRLPANAARNTCLNAVSSKGCRPVKPLSMIARVVRSGLSSPTQPDGATTFCVDWTICALRASSRIRV
jgi:hypothetical protein